MNTKAVNGVSDTRQRMHMELSLAVTQYLLEGHKVTVCKPQRNPKSRKVTGKVKLAFGSSQPKNRPSNAWDVLQTA